MFIPYSFWRYLKAQSAVIVQQPQPQPPSYNSVEETPQLSETVVQHTDQGDENRIKLRDILHFPAPIWLICIICVAYYVTVFPFISLGLVFFKREWNSNYFFNFTYIFVSDRYGFFIFRSTRSLRFHLFTNPSFSMHSWFVCLFSDSFILGFLIHSRSTSLICLRFLFLCSL